MVEAAHAIASGKLEKLSMQQILDCGAKNPCYGPWGSTLDYIAKNGLMKESDYKSVGGKCGYDASKVAVRIQSTN